MTLLVKDKIITTIHTTFDLIILVRICKCNQMDSNLVAELSGNACENGNGTSGEGDGCGMG